MLMFGLYAKFTFRATQPADIGIFANSRQPSIPIFR